MQLEKIGVMKQKYQESNNKYKDKKRKETKEKREEKARDGKVKSKDRRCTQQIEFLLNAYLFKPIFADSTTITIRTDALAQTQNDVSL